MQKHAIKIRRLFFTNSSTPGIDICTVSCIGPTVIGVSVSEIPVSPLAAITPYSKTLQTAAKSTTNPMKNM